MWCTAFFHRQTFKQGVVHIAFVNESWLTATEWDKAGLQRHIVAVPNPLDVAGLRPDTIRSLDWSTAPSRPT